MRKLIAIISLASMVFGCQAPSTESLEHAAAVEEPRQLKVITSGGFTAAFNILGPIPDELQQVSMFSTGIMELAANPDDAQRLIEFLSSDAVATVIESAGLRPVASE